MKKKNFNGLKIGDCFRLTKKGPVYMKSKEDDGQCILGRGAGRVVDFFFRSNKTVYPVKVKISEVG